MNIFNPFLLQKESKSFQFIFLLVILTTILKFVLVGQGFLALPDETRYFASEKAVSNFLNLKLGAGINALFNTHARPGDAFLKMIPQFFQLKLAAYNHAPHYSPLNSSPLFIYNFVIFIFIEYILYKFSLLLLNDKHKAIFSVLIFGCLTNSFIYLRHSLPYDESLLFFYLTFYLLIKHTIQNNLNALKYMLLGAIAFFSYLCYPGYFPLYLVTLGYIFFREISKHTLIKNTLNSFYYGVGSLLLLLLVEFTAKMVGESYLKDAANLSQTIIQGSFEESYHFIFKYLIEVEFLSGFMLTGAVLIFFTLLIIRFKKTMCNINKELLLLIVVAISIYLFYATLGYFFHKFVMYGRLIHQYLPIITCIGTFIIFKIIKEKMYFLFIIATTFVFSLLFNIYQFLNVSYPRDISWKLSKYYNLQNIENIYEYKRCYPQFPLDQFNDKHNKNNKILTLNLAYIPHPSNKNLYTKFHNQEKYKLMYSKPHFNNLKSYQFEGFTVQERTYTDQMKLNVSIYQK